MPPHTRESVVRLEPLGVDIVVPAGTTLMAAAQTAGYQWPTLCEGVAICTRCVVHIDPHDESAFGPMLTGERDALDRVRWRGVPVPGERLACQLYVHRDVTVRKRFVKQPPEAVR